MRGWTCVSTEAPRPCSHRVRENGFQVTEGCAPFNQVMPRTRGCSPRGIPRNCCLKDLPFTENLSHTLNRILLGSSFPWIPMTLRGVLSSRRGILFFHAEVSMKLAEDPESMRVGRDFAIPLIS